jgi:hypothetical protein
MGKVTKCFSLCHLRVFKIFLLNIRMRPGYIALRALVLPTFFFFTPVRRLPTRGLLLIYRLTSWPPRSADCGGCRIRSRDCCVGSLDLLVSAISTEPPQPRDWATNYCDSLRLRLRNTAWNIGARKEMWFNRSQLIFHIKTLPKINKLEKCSFK